MPTVFALNAVSSSFRCRHDLQALQRRGTRQTRLRVTVESPRVIVPPGQAERRPAIAKMRRKDRRYSRQMLSFDFALPKRNLYCRLWNWDNLQEYASQGDRANPALPVCSHSRNCPPPFEAGVSFFSVPSANVPPAMSWPEGGTRSRSPLNRSTMQIDRAPAGTEPTCPQDCPRIKLRSALTKWGLVQVQKGRMRITSSPRSASNSQRSPAPGYQLIGVPAPSRNGAAMAGVL